MSWKHHHSLKTVNRDGFKRKHKSGISTGYKSNSRTGREDGSVSVIAVTKYVDIATAANLIDQGVKHIGENRVDKFLEKYHALSDKDVTWHLIGSLQRRKVKDVIPYVDYFHALDSLKLAQEIQKRADRTVKCFCRSIFLEREASMVFKRRTIDSLARLV